MINKRTFIVTNIRSSPFRTVLIFLSVITFVVLLLALIGVIGIFAFIILGSLWLLFLVKNKIKGFIAKIQKPLPRKDTSPNLIELEKDEYKICE